MLTILVGHRWCYRIKQDPIARSLWQVEGIDRAHPENTSRVTFSGPDARQQAERYAMWMSQRR